MTTRAEANITQFFSGRTHFDPGLKYFSRWYSEKYGLTIHENISQFEKTIRKKRERIKPKTAIIRNKMEKKANSLT